MYTRDTNLWLRSTELTKLPVRVEFTGEHLIKTIALALVTCNAKTGNQYRQYIPTSDVIYHGRSVNCFKKKLSYGEGHATNANVYADFKLFLPQMVNRWLKDVIPPELFGCFSLDYRNLASELAESEKETLSNKFSSAMRNNREQLLRRCSESLSYSSLAEDFEDCYYSGYSWSDSFRNSLSVISGKFSDENYWAQSLQNALLKNANATLRKLYIFD